MTADVPRTLLPGTPGLRIVKCPRCGTLKTTSAMTRTECPICKLSYIPKSDEERAALVKNRRNSWRRKQDAPPDHPG